MLQVGGLIADSTKSHDAARDELARDALELGQAISEMVTAALKKEAAALAKAAGTTSDTIRSVLQAASAAASSTPERNTQKQLLALSKAVSECVYKLVEACKATGTSSAEVDLLLFYYFNFNIFVGGTSKIGGSIKECF